MLEGVPHFSARDLCAAMRWPDAALEAAFQLDYPVRAKRIVDETEGDTPSNGVYLSPVACWYWTHQVNPKQGQSLAAFTRREAKLLCPSPRGDDPAMFLTMTADDWMPPKPFRFSGRRSEWFALRDSPAYYEALGARVARKMNPGAFA